MLNSTPRELTYTLLALLVVSALGLLRVLYSMHELRKQRDVLEAYLARLNLYLESRGRDFAAYVWLTENAMKMQRQMGTSGIFAHFRPAFSNEAFADYPIIINHLPRLNTHLADSLPDTGQAHHYKIQLVEALLRHRGEINEQADELVASLRNPVAWFASGVRMLLAFPLHLLASFGLMAGSTLRTITSSWFFKLLASLAGLIGFVSAVVGLFTGWEQFILLARKHIPWLPWQ